MPIEKFYTRHEVAEIARATPSTVSFWIYTGRLTSAKVGRKRLIRESVLRQFLGLDAAEPSGERATGASK